MNLEKFDFFEYEIKPNIRTCERCEEQHCGICSEYAIELVNAAHEFYQKQVEGIADIGKTIGDDVYIIFNKSIEKYELILSNENHIIRTFGTTPRLYKTKEEALKALEGEDGK